MKLININLNAIAALVWGLIFATTSCDVVEQPPVSSFTEATFWQNETDANSSISGIYDALQRVASDQSLGNWPAGFLSMGDMRAGGINRQWGGTACCARFMGALILQDVSPDNDFADWNHFYDMINRANLAILNLPNIVDKDPAYTEDDMKRHLGEAYFLRAFAYFKMAQWWKEVPLVLEPTLDPSEDLSIAKSSEEEVLNQVKADIDQALQEGYLREPDDISLNTEESKGRATTMAAKALLVDYYMWKADYQQAADQALEIIESGHYTIENVDYYDNFMDAEQNSPESIFELQYSFSQHNETSGHVGLSFSNGWVAYGYTTSFIELVKESGDYVGGGRGMMEPWWYHGAWKFIGGTVPPDDAGQGDWMQYARPDHRNNWTNDNNWIFYRLADILLLRAEALNRINPTDPEIAELVNDVRERAGVPPREFSGDMWENEDQIMDERWIELHGEGKRWFDLIRASKDANGNLPTGPSEDHYLVQQVLDGVTGNTREDRLARIQDPGSWFFPIARREVELNRKLEQADYWK